MPRQLGRVSVVSERAKLSQPAQRKSKGLQSPSSLLNQPLINRQSKRPAKLPLHPLRSILLALVVVGFVACGRAPAQPAAAAAKVVPTYDTSTGVLTKLEADSDHDGLIDTWGYMEGTRVVRVEVDENGDRVVDRWEYHKGPAGPAGPAGQVGQVGQAPKPVTLRRGGVESPDKTIDRIERATRRDGVVSRWEYFEKGMLVRVEEDKNGDGRIDKWETYNDGSLATLAIDTAHRGKADRRLIYRPNGTLERIEIDPAGSGTFQRLSEVK
jgi:hypothetical protein